MRCRRSRHRRRLRALSVTVLCVAAAHAGEIDSAMFPLFWDCGTQQGVTLGDLDEDGIVDLVAVSDLYGACVRLGQGDGTFGPNTTFSMDGCAGFPVLADLDGDGHLDLVAVGYFEGGGTSFVAVLGNGDGTLGSASWFASGQWLYDIAVGDFDEDDSIDVVVAASSDGALLHRGTGDGQFLPSQSLTPGYGIQSVVVDDFNGDGHDDVLGGKRVLLGHGDGTFTLAETLEGPNPLRIVSGDLDGDGTRDLVAGDFDQAVSVFLANGDGTFQPPQQHPVYTSGNILALGDFDADRKVDLAVGYSFNEAGFLVSVLRGTGDGGFAPAESFGTSSTYAWQLAVADLDRDGHQDLVKSTYGGSVAMLNRGDGTFAGLVATEVDEAARRMTADDLDGDGLPDLAVRPEPGQPGAIGVLLGTGDGSFVLADEVGDAGESHSEILAAELGQGVFKDLASADELADTVRVYPGLGAGSFGPGTSWPVGAMPQSLAAADLDGDDDLDLVTGNRSGNDVSVLLQEPGGFAPEVRYPSVARPVDVALGLVDDDTVPDLAVLSGHPLTPGFAVQLGTGNGAFGPPMFHPIGQQDPLSVSLLDIDMDGEQDVVVVVEEKTLVFPGIGDGTFLDAIETDAEARSFADIDGDGRTDIVGNGTLALGNGDGTFRPPLPIAFGADATGDFDGDGRTDLAQFSFFPFGPEAWVLPNECLRADMRLRGAGDSFEWRAVCGAQTYSVYRHDFAGAPSDADEDGLPDSGYGECISDMDGDPTDTEILDPAIPLPGGNGFGYLVSWVDLVVEGGLGATSAGVPREISVPCP